MRMLRLGVRASNYSQESSTPSSGLYCSESPDPLPPLLLLLQIVTSDSLCWCLCKIILSLLLSGMTQLLPPSCPHSWLPSTNPAYFILASLRFLLHPFFLLPFPSFPAPTFLPPVSPLLYMPISCPVQLLYRPALHYIHLYRLCYPRNTTQSRSY